MEEKRKPGRPKKETKVRDAQISFFLTEEDAQYFKEFAEGHGFKSRSELFTAIAERLRIGGMSGMVFCKLGKQFANLIDKRPERQTGLYFGIRPLPPLIGDEQEPEPQTLIPFLRGLINQTKLEAEKC